jgi:RimJ/RimL family protein N-acetyltransferase
MYAPSFPVPTERLLLRPLQPADVDDVHAYQSLDEVVRYLPYAARTREQVLERLGPPHIRTTLEDENQALLIAVERQADGRVIGDVMLRWASRRHRSGEIGYVFHPSVAGRGYATEAARALLGMGFDGLGLHRIIGRLDARNHASAAVLRRLGMRQEAHLIENEWSDDGGGEWTDELDWAVLAAEWRAARG